MYTQMNIFEVSLIFKILERYFVTASLKLLLQFSSSFVEPQKVYMLTFQPRSCLNVLLNFIDWSSGTVLFFNPLNANPTKWSNIPKQFDGKLPTSCLSVFDHFVGLALKQLHGMTHSKSTIETHLTSNYGWSCSSLSL